MDRIALEQSLAAASIFGHYSWARERINTLKVSNTLSAILCGLDDLECEVQVGTGSRSDEDDPVVRDTKDTTDSNFFGSRLSCRVCER